MIKVKNRRIISEIATITYKANKKRNVYTIIATSMTTFLITVVLSVGMSYWNTISMREVRMNGMDYDIALTEPNSKQVEIIRSMDEVKQAGISVKCAIAEKYRDKDLGKLKFYWLDQVAWEKQCIPALESFEGMYPVTEEEILLSIGSLRSMGIDKPEVGMELPITYYTLDENGEQKNLTKNFVLSGYFKDYSGQDRGFVSEDFYNTASVKQTNLTLGNLLISLKNPLYSEQDIIDIQKAVSLGKTQTIQADTDTVSNFIKSSIMLIVMFLMILVSGYLFIYNMLYISVSKDIRYYGQLKTIGMTSVQLKQIVNRQVIWNSIIGIPLGAFSGLLIANCVVPEIIYLTNPILKSVQIVPVQTSVYFLASTLSFFTNWFGSRRPTKYVQECSPIEAIRYITVRKNKKERHSEAGDMFSMAWRNIFRDQKQAIIILGSFIIAVSIFLVANVIIRQNNAESILNATYSYDIQMKNETMLDDKKEDLITDDDISEIKKISGVENVGVVVSTEAVVPYQEEVYGKYYKALYESRYTPGGDYENDIELYKENPNNSLFLSRMVGIDSVEFEKLNKKLGNVLNENDFEAGKTAIVINDFGLSMENVIGTEMSFFLPNGENPSKEQIVKIAAIGMLGDNPAYFAGGYTPTFLISLSYAQQLQEDISTELINVTFMHPLSRKTEQQVKSVFTGRGGISYDSKLEQFSDMAQNEMQVKILGNTVGFIMAFLALLNYVNMMASSVENRRREFATLESIGMTNKQIRILLASEGAGYAIISILCANVISIPLGYFVFESMNIYNVAYSIPWSNNILLYILILTVCISAPILIYWRNQKDSIIEKLRAE